MALPPPIPRRSVARLALALAALALLAGCEAQPLGSFERPTLAANRASTPYTVFFQPDSPLLAYGEGERLSGYLRSLSLRPGEDLLMEVGNSGSATLDGQRVLALRRTFAGAPARVQVAAPLQQPVEEGVAQGPSNAVTVTVMRYDMIVVDCPDNEAQAHELTTPLQMIGCTNAVNLAGMAERPQDLFRPRPLGGMPAATSTAAIKRYEAGKVRTSTLISSTEN